MRASFRFRDAVDASARVVLAIVAAALFLALVDATLPVVGAGSLVYLVARLKPRAEGGPGVVLELLGAEEQSIASFLVVIYLA
jgi:hypothetical protein